MQKAKTPSCQTALARVGCSTRRRRTPPQQERGAPGVVGGSGAGALGYSVAAGVVVALGSITSAQSGSRAAMATQMNQGQVRTNRRRSVRRQAKMVTAEQHAAPPTLGCGATTQLPMTIRLSMLVHTGIQAFVRLVVAAARINAFAV